MRAHVKGAVYGLAAAALFGMSTPIAKRLLPETGPLVLATLLYLGAGLALTGLAAIETFGFRERRAEARLQRSDLTLLVAITALGGVAGPLLMLVGLTQVSGVVASLLLNLEAPFTMAIAVVAFREHLGARGVTAAGLVVAGAALLGVPSGQVAATWIGGAAIAGACLCWAVDNNLSQRLSVRDPVAVARAKAVGGGVAMLLVVVATGQPLPDARTVWGALALGAVSYGLSLVLDLHALRLLGAAREAAYFATAPFIGAALAVPLLDERVSAIETLGAAVMAAGVVSLLAERHAHAHVHEVLEHEHLHVHDAHHRHAHDGAVTEPHSHWHRHAPMTHAHDHVSDVHHRHRH